MTGEAGPMDQMEAAIDPTPHGGFGGRGRQDEGDDIGEAHGVTQEGAGEGAVAAEGRIADYDATAETIGCREAEEITGRDARALGHDVDGDQAFRRKMGAKSTCTCTGRRLDEHVVRPHAVHPPQVADTFSGHRAGV